MGRLLVGVDGSAESAAALRWAAWFGTRAGFEVHVAHAYQPGKPVELLGPDEHPTDVEDLEDRLRARLESLTVEVLADPSVVTGHLVVPGRIAESMVAEARRVDGTALVVGASGAGGAIRAMLGSVSRALTECPSETVVVVPRELELPADGDWTVVVGVDGSTGSSRALRWTASACAGGAGRVVAVHAVEPPEPDLTRAEQVSVVDEMRWRVEHEWCAPLRDAEVPYTTVVEVGPPEMVITGAADDADPACVVLGSRGLGALSQRLLGSITHRLVRELDWPTVVIPGPRDRVGWNLDEIQTS